MLEKVVTYNFYQDNFSREKIKIKKKINSYERKMIIRIILIIPASIVAIPSIRRTAYPDLVFFFLTFTVLYQLRVKIIERIPKRIPQINIPITIERTAKNLNCFVKNVKTAINVGIIIRIIRPIIKLISFTLFFSYVFLCAFTYLPFN